MVRPGMQEVQETQALRLLVYAKPSPAGLPEMPEVVGLRVLRETMVVKAAVEFVVFAARPRVGLGERVGLPEIPAGLVDGRETQREAAGMLVGAVAAQAYVITLHRHLITVREPQVIPAVAQAGLWVQTAAALLLPVPVAVVAVVMVSMQILLTPVVEAGVVAVAPVAPAVQEAPEVQPIQQLTIAYLLPAAVLTQLQ